MSIDPALRFPRLWSRFFAELAQFDAEMKLTLFAATTT